jgi:hypothetical protein
MVSILRLRSMITDMRRDLSEIADDKAATEQLKAFKGCCERFHVHAICCTDVLSATDLNTFQHQNLVPTPLKSCKKTQGPRPEYTKRRASMC